MHHHMTEQEALRDLKSYCQAAVHAIDAGAEGSELECVLEYLSIGLADLRRVQECLRKIQEEPS